MSSLVAALDGEKWGQTDVSAVRQKSIELLCSGRAATNKVDGPTFLKVGAGEQTGKSPITPTSRTKSNEAVVEGVKYKVVWSCLLLIEMLMTNLAAAATFQSLAIDVVGKISDLLRLYNSRTTQLVLGAGAIHSAARLKSINAKVSEIF